jgi:tetratricopeptide (TPR) repeat protein
VNKAVLTFLSAVLVIGLLITFLKDRPANNGIPGENEPSARAEKEQIQDFWKRYREATKHRIAGRLDEAVASYRGALALQEDHEGALYYYGNVSFELGDFLTAESAWLRLVRVNPSSARGHSRLGDLYLNIADTMRFDVDKAEAAYHRALEINKEETGPSLRLGQVALVRGDFKKAGAFMDAVIGSNFRSIEAHFFKGYIAWKAGQLSEAERLLAKAAEFSRSRQKPIKGVLGEGDTKSGNAPVDQHSLFYALIVDLPELEVTRKALRIKYRRLESFLREMQNRIVS